MSQVLLSEINWNTSKKKILEFYLNVGMNISEGKEEGN